MLIHKPTSLSFINIYVRNKYIRKEECECNGLYTVNIKFKNALDLIHSKVVKTLKIFTDASPEYKDSQPSEFHDSHRQQIWRLVNT